MSTIGNKKIRKYITKHLEIAIDDIGVDKIVQVVLDNVIVCSWVGEIVKEKSHDLHLGHITCFKSLFWKLWLFGFSSC